MGNWHGHQEMQFQVEGTAHKKGHDLLRGQAGDLWMGQTAGPISCNILVHTVAKCSFTIAFT